MMLIMLPASLSFIGFVQFMSKSHLMNSYIPLIIPSIASAGTVLFMKQYMDSCNRLFMDETVSEEITKRVFETTVEIIRNDDSSFEKLVGQISTKGGTTEAGINVLKQHDLGNIFDDCMNEAISKVRN